MNDRSILPRSVDACLNKIFLVFGKTLFDFFIRGDFQKIIYILIDQLTILFT
jgi:hypothetical protein